MALFNAVKKLAQGTIGTVLAPVDLLRDAFELKVEKESKNNFFQKRIKKVSENFREGLKEIDED